MIAEVLAGTRQWAISCTDVLDGLQAMPSGSVHCVVTSPPYFGLRAYLPNGHADKDKEIGLEPTLDAYLDKMVAVFREVRRVLRKDGTLWLNCGDSYAGGKAGRTDHGTDDPTVRLVGNSRGAVNPGPVVPRKPSGGFKSKDLLGVPWRLAFALQADGWWLRSDVVWSKPNPMPESVTDRPTRSHEYLFLLTKSSRYFYDSDAIREPDAGMPSGNGFVGRMAGERNGGAQSGGQGTPERFVPGAGRNRRSVWTIPTQPRPDLHFAAFPDALVEPCVLAGCPRDGVVLDPFVGRGTTVIVALRHGRRAVGLELNPDYVSLARTQIVLDCPLFNGEAAG